ncbi:glycosyltransferase [Pasteurellaceae bacterium TAE3-ERU1]|nr:glycosyltransferase [Pasteurellaceae bacterium TAE3-ERU1]
MKIIILSAGNSIHTIRWVNGLSSLGYCVTLITQHEVEHKNYNDNVQIISFPYNGVLGYFILGYKLRRIINEIKPDIVNAHYASGYGTTARLVNFKPYLLSVWGSDVYDFPHKSRFHHWLIKKNIESATAIASTSQAMANHVKKIISFEGEIFITPFGVDTEIFKNKDDEYCKFNDNIVIGTVKTMEKTYGVDLLILSFAEVLRRLKIACPSLANKIILRLVGTGGEIEQLKNLVKEINLEGAVEFLGFIEHKKVPDILNKLDIYVALSRSESFGVAILEASSCGLPVIVSNVGGLPEVVLNNKTGFIVNSEDVHQAADAIEKLVMSETLRKEMGLAGRQFVLTKYSWNKSLEVMSNVYKLIYKKFSKFKNNGDCKK